MTLRLKKLLDQIIDSESIRQHLSPNEINTLRNPARETMASSDIDAATSHVSIKAGLSRIGAALIPVSRS